MGRKMKVKDESDKAGLKLNIQKTKIMASGPISLVHFSSVAQSCLTLCKLMYCSLQGSSVHGILQARILKRVAISFSKGSFQPRDRTCVSSIGRWILHH